MAGYTIIQADYLDAAVKLARGCPYPRAGGSIEVSEAVKAMSRWTLALSSRREATAYAQGFVPMTAGHARREESVDDDGPGEQFVRFRSS